MKRLFLSTILFVLAIAVSAQGNVTTFLGVSVDGTKQDVIRKLLAKGAVKTKDGLSVSGIGDRPYIIKVLTHKGKVYRICLTEEKGTEKIGDAVSKYNALIDWHRYKSDEYAEYEYNHSIDETDEVRLKKYIHDGACYAEFFQHSDPQIYDRRIGFRITDEYGDFRMERFYDNIYNMPEGEL